MHNASIKILIIIKKKKKTMEVGLEHYRASMFPNVLLESKMHPKPNNRKKKDYPPLIYAFSSEGPPFNLKRK